MGPEGTCRSRSRKNKKQDVLGIEVADAQATARGPVGSNRFPPSLWSLGSRVEAPGKDPSSDAGSTFTAHCALFLGSRTHSKGSTAKSDIRPFPLRPVFQKTLNDSASRVHLCGIGRRRQGGHLVCAASVILLPDHGRQGV